MSFIQENKLTINLNLKKEYKIVHFSDVHVIFANPNDDKETYEKALKQEDAWYRVRKDFANHFNEICNEEHMIPSIKCLDNLIDYSMSLNIDALVMSGDILDYYSKSNLDYLTNALKRVNVPFILTCGNHEKAEIFDEITNNQSDFSVYKFEEFKLIGLDDSTKKINEKQLNLLKEELKDNVPIILCMHIPVMTKHNEKEMSKFDSYFVINYKECDETTSEFLKLIENEPLITNILCGHTHGKGESNFANNKKQFCASSGLIGYLNNITIK